MSIEFDRNIRRRDEDNISHLLDSNVFLTLPESQLPVQLKLAAKTIGTYDKRSYFGSLPLNEHKPNADKVHTDPSLRLIIVCDGVGRSSGSSVAAEYVSTNYGSNLKSRLRITETTTPADVEQMMSAALIDTSIKMPESIGYTTFTAAMIVELPTVNSPQLYVVNAGDSGCLLIRPNYLTKPQEGYNLYPLTVADDYLTYDKAYSDRNVSEALRLQNLIAHHDPRISLEPELQAYSAKSNQTYNVVGYRAPNQVNLRPRISVVPSLPGDTVLCLSDGVLDVLYYPEILASVSNRGNLEETIANILSQTYETMLNDELRGKCDDRAIAGMISIPRNH